MKRSWLLLIGLLFLMSGSTVYLLFRPDTLLVFRLTESMGWQPIVDQWRASVSQVSLPAFVVYCLPAGLWTTAYVVVMHALFAGQSFKKKALWAAIIPIIGAMSEIMQGIGWLVGTFDWLDMACYVVPYVTYLFIINQKCSTE